MINMTTEITGNNGSWGTINIESSKAPSHCSTER